MPPYFKELKMKMKIIIIAGAICLLCMGALKEPKRSKDVYLLGSAQDAPVLVVSDTNMTALAVNTSSWASMKAVAMPIDQHWNGVNLYFYGYGDGAGAGDPNNGTFSFDVYLVDYMTGAIPVSLANTATCGAQQMTHNPYTKAELNSGAVSTNYCWVDTISTGTVYYNKTLSFPTTNGSNGVACMSFDRKTSYGIYVRIYSIAGITTVTCVMNGY